MVILDADQAGRDGKSKLLKELYAGHNSNIIMLDAAVGRPSEEIEIEDIIGEDIVLEGISRDFGNSVRTKRSEPQGPTE